MNGMLQDNLLQPSLPAEVIVVGTFHRDGADGCDASPKLRHFSARLKWVSTRTLILTRSCLSAKWRPGVETLVLSLISMGKIYLSPAAPPWKQTTYI